MEEISRGGRGAPSSFIKGQDLNPQAGTVKIRRQTFHLPRSQAFSPIQTCGPHTEDRGRKVVINRTLKD